MIFWSPLKNHRTLEPQEEWADPLTCWVWRKWSRQHFLLTLTKDCSLSNPNLVPTGLLLAWTSRQMHKPPLGEAWDPETSLRYLFITPRVHLTSSSCGMWLGVERKNCPWEVFAKTRAKLWERLASRRDNKGDRGGIHRLHTSSYRAVRSLML